jgi:hypothetical protein
MILFVISNNESNAYFGQLRLVFFGRGVYFEILEMINREQVPQALDHWVDSKLAEMN